MVWLLYLTNNDLSSINGDFFSSNSKPNTFLAISSNRALSFNTDFNIVKVLCSGSEVLVNASVKEVRREGRLNVAKSMKKLGGKRKTSVAALGKSEESKSGPDIARSVEEPGGGRQEIFIAALLPTAQVAPDRPLLSSFLINTPAQVSSSLLVFFTLLIYLCFSQIWNLVIEKKSD